MSLSGKYQTRSFAAINIDNEIRQNSSSGGIFYAFAKKVIEDGGLVFGAAFDADGQVYHKSCNDLSSIKELMQSKYVESRVGNTYKQVKKALLEGQKVLFTGTPCQTYGLLSFIKLSMGGKIPDSLITVDFICHGVPSRLVWRKYLEEKSRNRIPVSINFRDKTNGWRSFSLKIRFDDNSEYINTQFIDPYLRGFLKNLYLRESCYQCQFRGIDRETDFTIADFWGVHKHLPELFDDQGTSIILAHNDKAFEMLKSLKTDIQFFEIEDELVVKTNSSVVKSVTRNPKRSVFFKKIKDGKSTEKQIISMLKAPITNRIARKIRKIIKYTRNRGIVNG